MASLRDYYLILKPERTFANVMTATAGFLFACAWEVDIVLLLATIVGTSLIVASACAVNNATDRKVDARMVRTRQRALVVGLVPIRHAIVLAIILAAAGFGLLIAYVNWLTVVVGVVGYIDYVILYSWSKRHTVHSTLIGTISGAAPIVAGYTAVTNRFDVTALLLALIMVTWQMAHFFAIGVYRVDDYRKAKLPIFSVVRGIASTQRQIVMYTALFLISLVLFAVADRLRIIFLVGMLPIAFHWLWAGFSPYGNSELWGRRIFGESLSVLLVFCGMLSVATILP